MSPLERAARAMQEEARRCGDPVESYVGHEYEYRWRAANPGKDFYIEGPALDDGFDPSLEGWKIFARAVLQAIREPSEGMIEAGAYCIPVGQGEDIGPPNERDAAECFRTMIDAALSE